MDRRTGACLLILMLGSALCACEREMDICAYGIRLSILDEGIQRRLISDLRDRNIPFQEEVNGEICYRAEDREWILGRMIELDSEALPPPTEFRIPGRTFAEAIIQELDSEGIGFDYTVNGSEYVISIENEEQIERTREIVQLVGNELFGVP